MTWLARHEDSEERGVAREGLVETWKNEKWMKRERSTGAREDGVRRRWLGERNKKGAAASRSLGRGS